MSNKNTPALFNLVKTVFCFRGIKVEHYNVCICLENVIFEMFAQIAAAGLTHKHPHIYPNLYL